MAAPPRSFTLDNGRIRLNDAVFVYLERTLAPGGPLPPGVAPRAYGLTPAGIAPSGSVVAAVAPGEAVWLGFQAVEPAKPATVRVRVDRTVPLDAVTGERWAEARADEPRNYLVSPPETRLVGVRQPTGGYLPFGLDGQSGRPDVIEQLSILSLGGKGALVAVELLPPATFTEQTGIVPEPLDPDSAYKGWRLP
jgi:hypothetical protein